MVTSTSRWWALAALSLSTIAIGLDSTVLSVALPTLAGDLAASTGDLQWFTTSYLLVLAAALLPAGMLGDRFGRKRMLLGALVVFGAASAACSYAVTSGQLVAARAVLGLGAAVIMPLSSAVLTVIFEPAERGRALTVWVTANTLGIPLGPLVGGYLLDHFWWGSVFLINVPLVLAGIVAVALWVPESHGDRQRRFDPLGVVLSAAGLVAVTYGIIEAGERGWSDARSLFTAGAGVALLAIFVWWQRRAPAPLVDLRLFRSRGFTWGALLATVASFAMFGLLFALPLLFQEIGGNDAFGTGLRLLPVIGGLMVGARIGGKLESRLGAKVVVTAGLVLIAGGLLLGTATGPGSGYGFIAIWISLAGAGLGLTMPPAMNAALGALSRERSGVGSGLIQALRQVGSAVGVAVLGTVLNGVYRDALDGSGLPDAAQDSVSAGVAVARGLGDPGLLNVVRSAFTDGMAVTMLVAAAVAMCGAVLSMVFLPGRPAEPDDASGVPRTPVSPPTAAESTV
jgi:MFS transporter, DHA2 family, multidrug resistance protein